MTHNQSLHIARARFSSDITELVRYPPCANPLHLCSSARINLQSLRIKDGTPCCALAEKVVVRIDVAALTLRATYLLHERPSQISTVPGNTTTSQSNSRKI